MSGEYTTLSSNEIAALLNREADLREERARGTMAEVTSLAPFSTTTTTAASEISTPEEGWSSWEVALIVVAAIVGYELLTLLVVRVAEVWSRRGGEQRLSENGSLDGIKEIPLDGKTRVEKMLEDQTDIILNICQELVELRQQMNVSRDHARHLGTNIRNAFVLTLQRISDVERREREMRSPMRVPPRPQGLPAREGLRPWEADDPEEDEDGEVWDEEGNVL